MNHPEHELQCLIVKALRLNGCMVFSVPNDLAAGNGMRRMMRAKNAGLWPGMSDLVLVSPDGRAGFLEVKAEGGVLSHYQKTFQSFCVLQKYPFFLAYSVDAALEFAKKNGFIAK